MASGPEFAQLRKSKKSAVSGSVAVNDRNIPCSIDPE